MSYCLRSLSLWCEEAVPLTTCAHVSHPFFSFLLVSAVPILQQAETQGAGAHVELWDMQDEKQHGMVGSLECHATAGVHASFPCSGPTSPGAPALIQTSCPGSFHLCVCWPIGLAVF